jgi:hypothetical protein
MDNTTSSNHTRDVKRPGDTKSNTNLIGALLAKPAVAGTDGQYLHRPNCNEGENSNSNPQGRENIVDHIAKEVERVGLRCTEYVSREPEYAE